MIAASQRTATKSLLGRILASLGAMQVFVQPVLAEECVNTSAFEVCRSIVSMAERLQCYETIVDAGASDEPASKQSNANQSGNEKSATDDKIDELAVTIVQITQDPYGKYYFKTSDGQIWKQLNKEYWSSTVPGEAIIRAGVLRSHFLVNEKGDSTRVTRVK